MGRAEGAGVVVSATPTTPGLSLLGLIIIKIIILIPLVLVIITIDKVDEALFYLCFGRVRIRIWKRFRFWILKGIRKFFLTYNKGLDGISGIMINIIFFPFEGL